MTQQAVLELPLDDDLLKVLASDTRREMLRLLMERRMTGSELATRLDLGKPAIAEHLKKLQDAGLIVRHDDEERRWVYYELSPRGESLLQPTKVRFYFVLSVAAAALLFGIALTLMLYPMLAGNGLGGASDLDDGAAQTLDGQTVDLGGRLAPDGSVIVGEAVAMADPLPEADLPAGVPPLPDPTPEPVDVVVVADNATENATIEVAWILPENLTLPADAEPSGFFYSRDDVDTTNGTVTVQVVYVIGNQTILAPVVLVPVLDPGNAENLTVAQAVQAVANATASDDPAEAAALDQDDNGILDWIEEWLVATPSPAPTLRSL